MKPIRINCSTPHCPNYEIVHADSDVQHHFTCSACDDALHRLMIDELERSDGIRRMVNATKSNPNIIMRSEDF